MNTTTGQNDVIQPIPISDIRKDPYQPRKTFDVDAIESLANSIKEKGVLQPITVTKKNNTFQIVMGERRFKACQLLGLETVPCIVRSFSKEDLREVQLIENIQRKKIEPVEEAEAIKRLFKSHSASEIATRIGRSTKYVFSRVKVANLLDEFKSYLRQGEMTFNTAIGIGSLSKEEQEELLNDMDGEFCKYSVRNFLDKNIVPLDKATFDVTDETLYPKAKSCTLCPFNTANQGNLFGVDKVACTKAACFNKKTTLILEKTLKQAKSNDVAIVIDGYDYHSYGKAADLLIATMEKNGLPILFKNNLDVSVIPLAPTMESVAKTYDYLDLDDEELKAYYKDELLQYEQELKVHNNFVKNAFPILLIKPDTYTVKEAFASDKVLENTKSDDLTTKKMASCTPSEQIEKLKLREIRKKQIEDSKAFLNIIQDIKASDYISSTSDLSADEIMAFSVVMYENLIPYHNRFDGFYSKNSYDSVKAQMEDFKEHFDMKMFNRLARMVLLNNTYHHESSELTNPINFAIYKAIESPCNEIVQIVKNDLNNVRTVRNQKLNDRIMKLENEIE